MRTENWQFNLCPDIGAPINWDGIEELLSLYVQGLKDCEQGKEFHEEGDVWTHTKMVCEALVSCQLYKMQSARDRSVLFLSALLHDIAKPHCTVEEEDGTITSKKHASMGARIARKLLWLPEYNLQVPWDIREEVSNMVMLHCLPSLFLEKKDPLYFVCASSYVVNNQLLAILSRADNTGRKCKDANAQRTSLGMVLLFEEFCEENGCLNAPRVFQSDYARFRYFFEFKGHPDFDRFEEINGKVIMMSGIQGAGKSTTISKVYSHLPIVGIDETREEMDVKFGKDEGNVLRNTKEKCREFMRTKSDFVLNVTNTLKTTRSNWIRLFRQYGYQINMHYVERPFDKILANNSKREKRIPETVIQDKFRTLEVPNLMECHELVLDIGE